MLLGRKVKYLNREKNEYDYGHIQAVTDDLEHYVIESDSDGTFDYVSHNDIMNFVHMNKNATNGDQKTYWTVEDLIDILNGEIENQEKEKCNFNPDKVDWNMRQGVLITKNQAKKIVYILKELLKEKK